MNCIMAESLIGIPQTSGSNSSGKVGVFSRSVTSPTLSSFTSGDKTYYRGSLTFAIPVVTNPSHVLVYSYSAYSNVTSTFILHAYTSGMNAHVADAMYSGNNQVYLQYVSGTQFKVSWDYFVSKSDEGRNVQAIFLA